MLIPAWRSSFICGDSVVASSGRRPALRQRSARRSCLDGGLLESSASAKRASSTVTEIAKSVCLVCLCLCPCVVSMLALAAEGREGEGGVGQDGAGQGGVGHPNRGLAFGQNVSSQRPLLGALARQAGSSRGVEVALAACANQYQSPRRSQYGVGSSNVH